MSTHVRCRMGIFALSLMLVCRTWAAPLKPPVEALKRMTKGGISLRADERPIGPKGASVLLHLWVVPQGRDPNSFVEPRDKNAPISREEITGGPSLKPSPFHLDVFARDNGWKLLNSVTFQETTDVRDVETRWLHPQSRRGPVVMLRSTYDAHWSGWRLITFPQGLRGKAYVQQFGSGGEGGIGVFSRFDRTDARGVMRVEEEEFSYINDRREKHFYNWNGTQFADPARYFLIAATTKTEEEAAAFVKRHKLNGAFVHWTDDFALLRHGYAVVILGRYSSVEAARKAQKTVRGRDFKTYVKRAF